MVCRRLLPRVINFKLAPTRRLGMTEMKRHNLVKKMLQTLIIEERLKTTNGKAKFIKFYADRVNYKSRNLKSFSHDLVSFLA